MVTCQLIFGKLELLSDGGEYWIVRCKCGRQRTVRGRDVRNGKVKQCKPCAKTTHGGSRHPLYDIWKGMIRRCYDVKATNYCYYGNRGITVCDSWQNFESFRDWITSNIGPRVEGMTLDRIDNDGNYEPGNVRWMDSVGQRKNQRRFNK